MQIDRRKLLLASALLCTLVPAALWAGIAGLGEDSLAAVEAKVEALYPKVGQIDAEAVARDLAGPDAPLLIDVREEAEHAVSRIGDAIHVPPDADEEELIAAIGDRARGRRVVVYCSVGMRSSAFANESGARLVALGAKNVANLRGGIFGWHNRGLPLVDAKGATELVHPYDSSWGRLVDRQALVRYEPRP